MNAPRPAGFSLVTNGPEPGLDLWYRGPDHGVLGRWSRNPDHAHEFRSESVARCMSHLLGQIMGQRVDIV